MLRKILLFLVIFIGILALLFIIPNYHADIPLATLKKKYTYPESQFVKINEMDVHYRVVGQGKPLVLLHGTAASLHTWEAWTENLKDSFQVISLDLPAYGLTGPHPKGDYSVEAYVSTIEGLIQHIGLDTFAIGGNSFGGFLSWNYALKYPEKVKQMILVDAAGFMSKQPASLAFQLAQNPLAASVLTKLTPYSLFENSIKEVYAQDDRITTDLTQRYFELYLRPGNRQAFVDRVNFKMNSNPAPLAKLEIPVLLMWGQEDAWIPVSHADSFANILKYEELAILPNLGHVPMEEAPEQTVKIARVFLEQN